MNSERKQNQKVVAGRVIIWNIKVPLCNSQEDAGQPFYSDSKNWEFNIVMN